MSSVSYRVSETRLFKERKSLGIEFCWETENTAVCEYYLLENFRTGQISVSDSKGIVLDKTDRILNLFRLGV